MQHCGDRGPLTVVLLSGLNGSICPIRVRWRAEGPLLSVLLWVLLWVLLEDVRPRKEAITSGNTGGKVVKKVEVNDWDARHLLHGPSSTGRSRNMTRRHRMVVVVEAFRDTKTDIVNGRPSMVHAPGDESLVLIQRLVTSLKCTSKTLPVEYLQNHS